MRRARPCFAPVVRLKAFIGTKREQLMIVSPPLQSDLGPRTEQDWEKASIPSTVGAVNDKKEHGAAIKKSFENHIGVQYGHWAKDFAGNKIPNTETLEKDTDPNTPWSKAWNSTMRMLKNPIKDLIHNSKEWPDNGFGGKRCVKQLLEILVLTSYVELLCDIISKELHTRHDLQKQKLSRVYADLKICPSDEELRFLDSASNEIYELSKLYKRLTNCTNEITKGIIKDFFNNTIKTNTIKSACHQDIVNGFVENPTVEGFEKLCHIFWKTSWKSHAHKQYNGWHKFAEQMEVDSQEVDDEDLNEPPLKRKRVNHSEQEKLRIKQKTGCICVGLPNGLRRCPFLGIKRPSVMLTHEHRIPVSLDDQIALQMSLEEDKNRWPMCPECDTIKTHYIDPIIRKHKEDFEFMQNYLDDYALPEQIVEEIKLSMKMDEPEAKRPVTYIEKMESTGYTTSWTSRGII